MKMEQKKALYFLGGALLAGFSLYYFNKQQILAFVGLMLGGYLILRALD